MSAATKPQRPPGAISSPQPAYDLIVLGGGVAGLTASLVAAIEGLRVLLIEKTGQAGGTSARSSGTVWIPDNPPMRAQGIANDAALAEQYLDALVGDRSPRALRQAFLAAGPEMIAYLARHSGVAFTPYPHAPDYRQDIPGAALGWRPLEPLAFDGRTLGPRFGEIGAPIPELTLFNGMMITRGEAARLLKLASSWDAWQLGARLLLRYAWDRLRYRRGTRLVLGNALVACLYRNVIERAVAVLPTPLATGLGLLTNSSAQVLEDNGAPIAGLYACGNDMHSVFGGEYPGAGAQLAQAMVFAYLAARHAAGKMG